MIEGYLISNLDLFDIPDLKRMELCRIHSVLLFLYNKLQNDTRIAFKYSEMSNIMNYNLAHETLEKLNELGLITIIQNPSKKQPVIVELKSNSELQDILNKDKKIEFEKYLDKELLTAIDIKEAIGCKQLYVHFDTSQIDSWLSNINKGLWDRSKFLTIAKIVTFFNSSTEVKTGTLNKRNSLKNNLGIKVIISELYEKIPRSKQEILYKQFENTVRYNNIKSDTSFTNMVAGYLHKLGYKEYN